MASSGNLEWAMVEGKRRAVALSRAYAVYQHKHHTADHILKPVEAGPPARHLWVLVATIEP